MRMIVNIEKIPRRFGIDLYFDKETGNIITLADVDEVLEYETEKIFEDYYTNLKTDRLTKEENKLMHSYVLAKAKEFLSIVVDKPYMKQRDALEYLSKQRCDAPFNLGIIGTVIKEYPKEYKDILTGVLDKMGAFDLNVSIDDIDKYVLDEETLVNLSETLSIPATKELYIDNFINKLIKYIYSVVLDTVEYNTYLNTKLDELMPTIDKELVEAYDKYKFDNFENYQLKKATDIVNLYDFVLNNKYVSWLDKGNKIYMITSMKYVEDKVYLFSDICSMTILKYDIKEMYREGERFTIVV